MRISSPRIRHLGLSRFALCAAILVPSSAAMAQRAGGPPTGTAASDDDGALAEIVVTAERRSSKIDEVPATIAVLSGSAIQDRKIDSMSEALAAVSNVDVKSNQPGVLPVFTIRGVGLNDFGGNTNPPVGVYIDDVPLSTVVMMNGEIYDVERVEVLKGPQGTLYGRNTTAGAVNFITTAPKGSQEGYLRLGAANYETFSLELMQNIPVSPALSIRVVGKVSDQGEGWWKSRRLDGSIGKRSMQAGRASFLWEPSETYSSLLKVEGFRQRGQLGYTEFFGALDPATFGLCASILAGRSDDTRCVNLAGYTDPDGDPYVGDWDRKPVLRSDGWDVTWKNELNLDIFDVTSITGYRKFKQRTDTDVDASPFPIADYLNDYRTEQFSQELRLGQQSGALDWIVGGFYSWDDYDFSSLGNNRAIFNTVTLILARQETNSLGLFGHGRLALGPKLTLTTGVRYTWEKKHYIGSDLDLNPLGGSVLCGGCATPFTIVAVDDTISDQNVTGTIGLDYKPDSDTLLYTSVSRGQKSGGFYSGFATAPEQLAPYKPEKLTAYELGVKKTLLGRSLQVNLSAFYYDYRDVQTFIRSTAGALPVQILSNVGKAKVKGIDFDMAWRPVNEITLQAAIGLLDTKLGSFVDGSGITRNGNELPNAPTFSFKGSASYDVEISGGYAATFSVQPSYASSTFRSTENTLLTKTPGYWLMDANIALKSSDAPWSLTLWAKNLTDKRYVTQVGDFTGLSWGYKVHGAPRTFGITAGYKW